MYPFGNKSRVLWNDKIYSNSLSLKKNRTTLALRVYSRIEIIIC